MSKYRGYKIQCINDVWVYSDNQRCVSQDKNRACGHCGREQTPEGHDGCIGTLKGVMNACCGHGSIDEAYIQFYNGKIIRGSDVLAYLKESAFS